SRASGDLPPSLAERRHFRSRPASEHPIRISPVLPRTGRSSEEPLLGSIRPRTHSRRRERLRRLYYRAAPGGPLTELTGPPSKGNGRKDSEPGREPGVFSEAGRVAPFTGRPGRAHAAEAGQVGGLPALRPRGAPGSPAGVLPATTGRSR